MEGPIGIVKCSTDLDCNLLDMCNIKKPIHRYWNYCFEKHHLNAVQHIIVTADSDLCLLQQYYQQKKHLNLTIAHL